MTRKFHHGDISGVLISRDGVTRSLVQWATVLGVPYSVVRMRYKRGKRTFEELLGPKGKQGMRVSIDQGADGETRVVQVEHTMLDDLLSADLADKVRQVAKQYDMSPLQVVAEVVDKQINKLLTPQQTTN